MSKPPDLTRGCTFLIPAGPSNHLHFVCGNPVYYPSLAKECVLLVNISSVDPYLAHDATCVLNNGDHPFINHESYVYYRKADIFGCDSIRRSLAEGAFTSHAPCQEPVISRILEGFAVSNEVRPRIKSFYQKYCTLK